MSFKGEVEEQHPQHHRDHQHGPPGHGGYDRGGGDRHKEGVPGSAPDWDWERDRARDRDRDRERERERDRERARDRGDRGEHRDREAYDQNGHGHLHGRPRSTVIQGSGSGSACPAGPPPGTEIGSSSMASSFRKDSSGIYDQHQAEGGRPDRDHLDREPRFSDAGLNGASGADTIYISNLPEAADEDNLLALLHDTGLIKVNKTGAPMVRLYRDKVTGVREAEVVLDDPRAAPGLVNWYNGYDFKGSKIQVTLGHPASGSSHDRRAGSYGSSYDHDGPPHVRSGGYRGGRGRGRHNDRFRHPPQPMSGMGRGFVPFPRDMDDGFGGPGDLPHGSESFGRNNPNVTPREGDWICPEPTCGNLNFARRTHCNNCNKSRRDLATVGIGGGGPQGNFRGPPPHVPFMGSPMGRGMGRGLSGFGGPPPVWGHGPPRHVDVGPIGRISDRVSDFRGGRYSRDRDDMRDRDDFRDRGERFERPPFEKGAFGGGHIDRDRDRERFRDRRVADHEVRSDRRPLSPRPRWGRDFRERTRSPPMRSEARDYHHKGEPMYMDRRREDRRDDRRDRKDDHH